MKKFRDNKTPITNPNFLDLSLNKFIGETFVRNLVEYIFSSVYV